MHRRDLLKCAWLAPVLGCAAPAAATRLHVDAMVTRRPGRATEVPAFASIADAIAAAPANSAPWRICIDAGNWREKLLVDRANVELIGAGARHTTIQFDAAAGQNAPDGTPWGTWGCATLRVVAPGFRARDLGIANTFDYLGHLRAPQLETTGSNGAQAVALMLDHGSTEARIEHCHLRGHQDTVFVDAGRSLFRDCAIEGSVDFVFGAGQALFADCVLRSLHRPGKARQGYIAAPSTLRTQATGLVFVRCRLTRDPVVPDGSVALGRAWRPTRAFADGNYGDPDAVGAAAYIDCSMAAHIAAEGWDPMNYTARDGTRIALLPEFARFCEYANRGQGARLHAGRAQLSRQQAEQCLRDALPGATLARMASLGRAR